MEGVTVDYRFRAECSQDVKAVVSNGWFTDVSMEQDPDFPDVEVKMKTHHPLDKIRELLSSLPDGHVMAESVNYADKYTGERYDID